MWKRAEEEHGSSNKNSNYEYRRNEHGSSIGVASGNAGGSHGRQQGCDWCGNQYRGNRGTEELALALTKGLTVNI